MLSRELSGRRRVEGSAIHSSVLGVQATDMLHRVQLPSCTLLFDPSPNETVGALTRRVALACRLPASRLVLFSRGRRLGAPHSRLPRGGALRVVLRQVGGGSSDMANLSLPELFAKFDINGDGIISREEFTTAMTATVKGCATMSRAEAENIFKRFDADGNGTVDVKEFMAAWEPAHQPPAREVPVCEKWRWETYGGGEIEAVLSSGAIVLLDAQWMVDLADSGGVLLPRQALPDAAFLSLSEVQAATSAHASALPVICISHCWLQPDHPDPRGHNLRVLARALKSLLAAEKGRRHAVFYDFCCIHQCCRDSRGAPKGTTFQYSQQQGALASGAIGRYASEHGLFKQALGSLGAFYSHPATTVLMLTAFPSDYNDKKHYARSGNTQPYFGRGWCYCESSWAMMVKGDDLTLDLGRMSGRGAIEWGELRRMCTQGRKAPVLPATFEDELKNKAFTNGKTDLPLVGELYRDGFTARFGAATGLQYGEIGWGDAEATALGTLLGAGAAPNLTKLHLGGNSIGDAGACALAKGFSGVPLLKELNLKKNAIGDAGAVALADGLRSIPDLERLHLDGNAIKAVGATALGKALPAVPALEWFYLSGNPFGDAGASAIAAGLAGTLAVEWLYMSNCAIKDDGARALAKAFASIPSLEWLDLDGNKIGDAGVTAIAEQLGTVPALERLYLRKNLIGDEGAAALANKLSTVPVLRWLYLEGNDIKDQKVIKETITPKWGRRGSGLSL
jgi:Ran GTPase-activating protein (RanGAP) involved in mRNA processing and transport